MTTEPPKSVGECGVCMNALPVGANHAYTMCRHLFCISCLLKWDKANPNATCPMCRAPLHEDEAEANAQEAQGTWMTLQEMDLTSDERAMHEHMMHVVNAHAEHYCRNNPTCTYMGTNSLRTIRNRDHDYNYVRVEVGVQSPNCHYIIELRDSPRAFRYKFGRIEEMRRMHPIFEGVSWFVFRELIDRWDNDTGHMQTVWSHETQLIAAGGDVNSLRQYVPRIRMSV